MWMVEISTSTIDGVTPVHGDIFFPDMTSHRTTCPPDGYISNYIVVTTRSLHAVAQRINEAINSVQESVCQSLVELIVISPPPIAPRHHLVQKRMARRRGLVLAVASP